MGFTKLVARSERMSFRNPHKPTPYESLPVSRKGNGGNQERGSWTPSVNRHFPPMDLCEPTDINGDDTQAVRGEEPLLFVLPHGTIDSIVQLNAGWKTHPVD